MAGRVPMASSLGGVSGQARSKVAEGPGLPALQTVSSRAGWGGNHKLLSPAGQETPSILSEGGWRHAACQRSPSSFLTSDRHFPFLACLPRGISPAAPLTGPDSEN